MHLRPLATWLVLGGLLLPFIGCGLGAADNFAPLTVFDNFRTIAKGQAYRSAQLDASSLRLVIEQYGIRTILNLRGENEDRAWYQAEQDVAAELGVTLIDIPMSASHLPPRDVLLTLYDSFYSADYPILMHCQAGADRTGAAAALWRMTIPGDPRAAALSELSLLSGHFEVRHPEMDQLARMYQPDRTWIETEYNP